MSGVTYEDGHAKTATEALVGAVTDYELKQRARQMVERQFYVTQGKFQNTPTPENMAEMVNCAAYLLLASDEEKRALAIVKAEQKGGAK